MKMNLQIRAVNDSDREFVTNLMEQTLSPFYDGDNRAHAERILNTNLKGNDDTVGHFSFEQRMFVAVLENGERVGFVNIVGKKQGNYKISPLILDPKYRGIGGFGTQLLEFVEQYVQMQSCRQLYCTVAGTNTSALNFFLGHGFILAGQSVNHYKIGINEQMLYKRFIPTGELVTMDSEHISIKPFEYIHREQFRTMVYQQIIPYFKGVDDSWIQATFDGYDRRNCGDINLKSKLMFEAVNQRDEFCGACALTPKKGQPIKIMPLVVSSPQAFLALLEELPKLVYEFGSKLYIHIVPTVEQVTILQKLGWVIEAMFPGAYNDNITTQQWGLQITEIMTHTLRLKNAYLKLIKSREKMVEVRVGYESIKRIKIGEKIKFITYGDDVLKQVKDIQIFPDFEDLLRKVPSTQIIPGKNNAEVLAILRQIYPQEKEVLGVYSFTLE